MTGVQTCALPIFTRLPGVTQVQDTGTVNNVNAFRSPLIPSADTNALTVDATSLGLPATVGTSVAHGSYLNPATAREPVAVLGAAAAQRLGIDRIFPGERARCAASMGAANDGPGPSTGVSLTVASVH